LQLPEVGDSQHQLFVCLGWCDLEVFLRMIPNAFSNPQLPV